MTFDVAIGDRLRTVGIVRKGALLHVDVDGRVHIVDARRVSDSIVSMLVRLDGSTEAVRSIDAAFAQSTGSARSGQAASGDLDVHLDGLTIPVEIRPAGSFGRLKREGAGGHGGGPQRVIAPMPGKVVRVLVGAGDTVTARQGLVVVEAMKMENELRAARDGRVREVAVKEGQSVDAGTVLLTVE
jgi:biotin carboxyl carrier protein